jgi:hypothetical protein
MTEQKNPMLFGWPLNALSKKNVEGLTESFNEPSLMYFSRI